MRTALANLWRFNPAEIRLIVTALRCLWANVPDERLQRRCKKLLDKLEDE